MTHWMCPIGHRADERSKHRPKRRINPPDGKNLRQDPALLQPTEKQKEVLEFIREFARLHGYVPARREIMEGLKLRNKSVVDQRLVALQAKGWLDIQHGGHRNLRLLCEELPVVVAGTVAAGEPILAEERVQGWISRAAAETFRPPPDFFLRVQGGSMSRLGLVDGSTVAIRSQPTAENKQVIVARIEDEVTLKRFVRVNERRVQLRSESYDPSHPTIEVDLKNESGFAICGIVVGALIRDGLSLPV